MDTSQNIDSNSREEILETKLSLQKLQFNRLLEITQAINNNIPIADLFNLYKGMLTWEMRVDKFALYTRNEDAWECVTSSGIDDDEVSINIESYFPSYQRRQPKTIQNTQYRSLVFRNHFPCFDSLSNQPQGQHQSDYLVHHRQQ